MKNKNSKIQSIVIVYFLILLLLCIFTSIFTSILTYSVISKIDLSINPPSYAVESNTYLVIDVIDGDTIKVERENKVATVRLIGIDAPEVRQKECKYKESTEYLEELILNKRVNLEADFTQENTDRYGRELRYIFINNLNVNKQMLTAGMAKEYTYRQHYKYQLEFILEEKNAILQSRGVWSSECN